MKILILYGSITGNTEATAAALFESLSNGHPEHSFELLNLNITEPEQLAAYDAVIFGTSTWDENSNPDTEDFLIKVETAAPDFAGKAFALFGLGDSAYPIFCGALPLARAVFEKHGGRVFAEFFTIDGFPPEQVLVQLVKWAEKFVA